MTNNLKATLELRCADKIYTLITNPLLKNIFIKFRLGEEFFESASDGSQVKSIATLFGDSLIIQELGEKSIKTVYKFSNSECAVTIFFGGLEARRWYSLIYEDSSLANGYLQSFLQGFTNCFKCRKGS